MKTINSLRSKLLVLTLALMAGVSSFAYDEMPDFQVDGLYYNFLEGDNVEVTHPYRPEMPTEGTSTTATQDLYDDYAELTELTIPSTISYEGKVYNVIRIGYAAFDQCNLTYVDIPSSIKTIGVGAFSNCTSLTSITLKEGLEHIEGNAFADCRLLETITFPNSLKTVGSYAFSFTAWYNNQPNGGVYAGNVFYKYKGDIPENTSFVIKEGTVSISPDAFIKENRRIDYGLVAVAIPNSVEIIGEYAFSQCRALRSVNIPSRVTTIESYAFSYCKSLTSVTSEIVEPLSLPSDVFFKASVANATLYVPAESVEAYKNADQWKDFGQVLPIAENPEDLFPTLWGLQRTSCSEYVDCQENETYLMQADEIKEINGKQYLKYGGVFLREEDSKVLIYSFPYEKDFVLYDWTLAIGDTLQILGIDPFSFPELEYTAVVDYVAFEEYDANGNRTIVKKPLGNKRVKDISTIRLLDGNEYKAWLFGYDWERGNYYVEGIGNASKYGGDYVDLVYPFEVPSCYYGERLVCVSRDGVLLYQIDDAEMERLGTECLCEVETSYKSQWCDTWNVMEHNMGGVDDSETTWRHYLANDTIINGQTYTSVNYYWTLEESKVYKIAHVRFSEDKKVYALMDDTEYLVYDFSVQVGDTIETIVGAFYGSMLQQLLVHQIDIDEETNRKTIILFPICKCDEDLYCLSDLPIIWIEGVGTTDGFLMGYPPCDWVGGIGCNLLCAYKDDELKYTGDLYDVYGCEYNATEQKPEDLFPTLWGLQRTSFTEYSECSDSYASLFQSKGETITINYNQYLKFGGHYLREENKQVLLYSRLQDKDLVLYDYSLEVGDTLTTLNIDYRIEGIPFDLCYVDYAYEDVGMSHSIDTLIVTDVSYVTLLDGKEYKKWTFDNGMEYVEGIGNFGQSRWSGNFFGLVKEPAIPPCLMGEHLVCVSKNNKLLYQMDDAEMERLGTECLCDYNSGPKKDNAKNGKIGGRPTPTQWNQLELDLREMENGNTILRAETFSYTLENDSIVTNGKTYYQLARQSTKDTAITKSFVGALHFGEDEDNRVYFLRDGVEYVLYDFTAEPGDTIEIFAGINNYPQYTTYTHVVTGKDTLENGACRMMLEVVFPEETASVENAQKVWLAGLGSIDGIVHNAAQRTSDAHAAPAKSASSETQTSVMLCAWREDSCLYTTNHPEYDTFGCVYNQDPTALENPTSPSSYQKILHEGKLLILHNGKIYNVLGVSVN